MKIEYELKHIVKDGNDYYLIRHYFVFDSGKRYQYATYWITKSQYTKLGGK